MAKRTRIGILFMFGRFWMGGVYYLSSLIQALNFLDDSDKPEIVLYYDDLGKEFLDILEYPYLQSIYLKNFKYRSYLKFFFSIILNRNLNFKDLLIDQPVSGVFPVYNFAGKIKGRKNKKMVAWFPDLQHKFYPEYFSRTSLIARDFRIKKMLSDADALVLSSEDVHSHFKRFFKFRPDLEVHIMPFVSIIDHIPLSSKEDIFENYNVDKPYFIVCNQFYEHKNHIVIFEAVSRLLLKRSDFLVLCTGELYDNVNSTYVNKLIGMKDSGSLDNNLKILGYIPREDQLSLMKNSLAVVQPSKFEGWSTVVEDGKSLQVQVIASDIPVHREQLGERGFYFQEDDVNDLVEILESFLDETVIVKEPFTDYEDRIAKYAAQFVSIFN